MFSLVKSYRQVEARKEVAWCGGRTRLSLYRARWWVGKRAPEAKQTAEWWESNRFSQGGNEKAVEALTICLESSIRVNFYTSVSPLDKLCRTLAMLHRWRKAALETCSLWVSPVILLKWISKGPYSGAGGQRRECWATLPATRWRYCSFFLSQ